MTCVIDVKSCFTCFTADILMFLLFQVRENFNLQKNGWRLCKDKGYGDELSEMNQKSLKGLKLG